MPDREAEIKEEMKHPEELSDSKANMYAAHLVREELEVMEDYLQLLELQARRSLLFTNIDMDIVRKAIYELVKVKFLDKHEHIKQEYVDLIINDYVERYAEREFIEFKDDEH